MKSLDVSSFIIIFIQLLTLSLGLTVFLRNPKDRIAQSFSIITFFIVFWALCVFLADNSTSYFSALFWTKMALIGPILFCPFLYHFSLIFPSRQEYLSVWKSWLLFFIFPVVLLVFTPTYFNVASIEIKDWGVDFVPGVLYSWFLVYLLLYLFLSLYNLVKKYRNISLKIEKKRISYVFSAFIVLIVISILTNVLLPFAGISISSKYGTPFSVFMFVFLIFLAIVKGELFQIRVIAAQAFTVVTWLLVGIELFIIKESSFLLALVTFAFIVVFGLMLIRSVKDDLKRREELQRMNVQLARSRQKLTQANAHLKILDQTKTDFVNIASHQLRTPLGSMRWSMEMLLADEAGAISDEAKEMVQQIYENNQRMGGLVNDLLNVARIEQGRVTELPELTNVVTVLEEVVKTMSLEAKHKDISLKFKVLSKNIPSIMIARKRFFEIIQNLISNAIKYNRPQGSVVLSVQTSQKHMRIIIEDTGIGIPQSEQSKIFSKFFRAGNAIVSNIEGTGLGLFVVKSFVEENGGIVRFKSQEGTGTTFYIELPLLHHSFKVARKRVK